jgi:nicotinate phosphoribosyltransferase
MNLPDNFIGTSNVYLARKYGLKPIGTMAHEWIMAGQGIVKDISESQKYMLQSWANVYRGDLGIALSDTLGSDTFLNDFDKYFCKLYDGCRHDSGDPYTWCDKLLEHYAHNGIDPTTKTAVFSDGLTVESMIALNKRYCNFIKVLFGIGTNLTNDCGITPLQIVIKMTKYNGNPVAKISDSKGKQMCEDKDYLRHLCKTFGIPMDKVE